MVSLVGGGLGVAELITVKGQRRIKEADCIIYDRLISPDLLKSARNDCDCIYVGKENHHHTMKQEDINRLLVEKAGQYEKVVRLKGGDPYVFGRGGEEALALREHGIAFEIVPGISSAIAGLAYAGIPITHRGVTAGFHVVTAHDRNDGLAEIDFNAMAKGKETCVFLMGLSKVKEIADSLLEAGMPEQTPAAVISNAASAAQQTCTAPLNKIAEAVKEANLLSPALIVVGKVVELREQLNFFEQKKLFGKKYIVTGIGTKKSRLSCLLEQEGAQVTELAVGEILRKKAAFSAECLREADWLIFTSVNGVRAFFENLEEVALDARSMAESKIASIGKKTSAALREHGIRPDFEPEEANAQALAAALKKKLSGKETVWYLKAAETEDTLRAELAGKCDFREIVLYENRNVFEKADIPAWLGETCDGVFFTCASSVRRFFAGIPDKEKMRGCICYSIGRKTTEALEQCGAADICEAERADYEALAECAKANA